MFRDFYGKCKVKIDTVTDLEPKDQIVGYGIREIATHIEGLYFDKGDNIEDNEVYNLSGTKVGKGTLDTLPKGIYILNGRKYVKK